MAGGSSRSAFNVAFATDNNIADITAKATSQTICTSIVGTSVGLALAAAIQQSASAGLTCYAALAAVHMWTGYQSARSVPLATLNPSRLALLAEAIVQGSQKLPTPAQLASDDPVLPRNNPSTLTLVVGSSLRQLAGQNPELIAELLPIYRERKHMLIPGGQGKMHLVLHETATAKDAIAAALQAAAWLQTDSSKESSTGGDGSTAAGTAVAALRRGDALTPGALRMLREAGWDVERIVLEARRRRAEW